MYKSQIIFLYVLFISLFSACLTRVKADDLATLRQELATLKIEVQQLRKEVDKLKTNQQQPSTVSKPSIAPGKSICPQCRGTGKRFVICAVCNGTGKETYSCPFCNGRGKNGNNICNACKGKGTMQRTCNSCSTLYSGPETRGQSRRGNFEVCGFCGGCGKK
jgi:hypothetical protein